MMAALALAVASAVAPPPPALAPLLPPPANPRTASNVIFAEAFGSGLLYSLNYERLFDRWHLGLRGGASVFTTSVSSYGRSGNLVLLSFPVVASYYLAWRNHNLQLGLGATLLYTKVGADSQGTEFVTERSGVGIAASAVVGYRYLPRRRGITFGVAFTPLLRASAFLPWGGASFGYVF